MVDTLRRYWAVPLRADVDMNKFLEAVDAFLAKVPVGGGYSLFYLAICDEHANGLRLSWERSGRKGGAVTAAQAVLPHCLICTNRKRAREVESLTARLNEAAAALATARATIEAAETRLADRARA